MSDARKYSDTEVRAIIERALSGEVGSDGLSHQDLLAVGEQVGVSAEAMARAATEVREAQLDGAATKAVRSRRRRWLAGHAGLFALVNGLLFAVNFLTTPGEWWALFPVFFWGLALALHAGFAFGAPLSKSALERERRRLSAPRRVRVGAPSGAIANLESAPDAELAVAPPRSRSSEGMNQ
jgi:2TM domain